ncbi:MAG: acyl carrier protein [Acidiphilium sp.]|nr:acyl carrier protein [Acidiphilium sp.]
MTDDEVLAAMTPIFRDAFSDDVMTPTMGMSAKDVPGWDSYKQVNILIAVEERFGVKFRSREIDRLGNVGDLVGLVRAKLAG